MKKCLSLLEKRSPHKECVCFVLNGRYDTYLPKQILYFIMKLYRNINIFKTCKTFKIKLIFN